MSITRSKRISIKVFWNLLSNWRTHYLRRDVLIMAGMKVDRTKGTPIDEEVAQECCLLPWEKIPEDWQEKIYNCMVQL